MPVAAKKRYQNTTVRVPRYIYEQAKTVISRSQSSSFNEFVVEAIQEKVCRLTEAEIDAAFAQMAQDPDYQSASIAMAEEFKKGDWEAFQSTEAAKVLSKSHKDARTSKTRSR
jgi:L-lactate utilization protein LutC